MGISGMSGVRRERITCAELRWWLPILGVFRACPLMACGTDSHELWQLLPMGQAECGE